MDKGYSQPLYRFEWVLCGLWSAAWMSIAWIAFTARHSMAVPAAFAGDSTAADYRFDREQRVWLRISPQP